MLPKVSIHIIYLLYFTFSLWKAYYKLDSLVSTTICLTYRYLKLLLLTQIMFVIVLTVNNMGPIVLLTFEITNSGAIILCYLWGSLVKFNKKLVQSIYCKMSSFVHFRFNPCFEFIIHNWGLTQWFLVVNMHPFAIKHGFWTDDLFNTLP